jgi:hypothetical protein
MMTTVKLWWQFRTPPVIWNGMMTSSHVHLLEMHVIGQHSRTAGQCSPSSRRFNDGRHAVLFSRAMLSANAAMLFANAAMLSGNAAMLSGNAACANTCVSDPRVAAESSQGSLG